MQDIEFNLLDEPWICVLGEDCKFKKVSLTDALLSAHSYVDLAGELPTQDIAIFRLLLAVLYTVFSRLDEEGNDAPFEEKDDALDRWEDLWHLGRFPEKPIRDYLNAWRDRFWLFHPDRPFYQVKRAEIGTSYNAPKLNGELSESSDKTRLFQVRNGHEKRELHYDEAARWLVHLNAFDDSSNKPVPRGAGLPAIGTGWLGKLGLIQAVGNTLFETLMLNLVLWDERQMYLNSSRPVWELDKPRDQQRSEIAMPDNQAELLTLQSRRIMLRRDNGFVTGYDMIGGDFFGENDAFMESMTLWRRYEEKGSLPFYKPRLHNPDKFIWQEFNTIIPEGGEKRPGIVEWLMTLQNVDILPGDLLIRFRAVSNQYDDKNCSVVDVKYDELAMHINLLSELGVIWQAMINREIELSAKCADCIGQLAMNLDKAAGDNKRAKDRKSAGDKQGNHELIARARFFEEIDIPFRKWLADLDATASPEAMREFTRSWHEEARRRVRKIGTEMIEQTGNIAYIGRTMEEEAKGKKEKVSKHYSSPEAWNIFLSMVKKVYPVD